MLGRRVGPLHGKMDSFGQRRTISSILGQSPITSNKLILRPTVNANPAAKQSTKQALPPLNNGSFNMNMMFQSSLKKVQRKVTVPSRVPELINLLQNECIKCSIEVRPLPVSDSVRMAPRENAAVCGHLEELLKILSEPGAVEALEAPVQDDLLALVQRTVLREIPEIPKQFLYGDTYAPLSVTSWDQLRVYHKIMLLVIKGLPKERLLRWVDAEFLRRLSGLFNSPDPEEQVSADTIFMCLFEHLPQIRNGIFKAILGVVNLYLDGLRPFVVVSPSLRFFSRYFNTMALGWNPQFNVTFRNVFIRLFSTDMVKEFYQQLSELCTVFYKYDAEAPDYALRYLLRHWPQTNTWKQEIFLHHTTVVVPYVKLGSGDPAVPHLFSCIRAALASPNFRVCEAGLKVIGEATFLCYFQESFGQIIPDLCTAVSQVVEHWNPDVQKRAKEVLEIVTSIDVGSDHHESEQPTKDRTEVWTAIRQAAS